MAYVNPAEGLENIIESGATKANMSDFHMIIRGFLAGAIAILAFATMFAFTAVSQTSIGLTRAMVFLYGMNITKMGTDTLPMTVAITAGGSSL